jgi:hypothetical protein
MNSSSVIDFWARHRISPNAASILSEPAIEALESSKQLFTEAFSKSPLPEPTSGVWLRALENLSDRLYEQAVGMLICLGTGSAAAAETIGRTIIEGAFNLLYISSQHHKERLFSYFYQYLNEHNRKLDEWQNYEKTRPSEKNNFDILKAIEDRRQAHQAMYTFVEILREGLSLPSPESLTKHWPRSLFKRCEQIDRVVEYLTSYHRLSASSHINAEETIRWLLGYYHASNDRYDIFEKLGLETINYSAMMSRISTLLYIESSAEVCRALDAPVEPKLLYWIITKLKQSISDISTSAGCPIKTE